MFVFGRPVSLIPHHSQILVLLLVLIPSNLVVSHSKEHALKHKTVQLVFGLSHTLTSVTCQSFSQANRQL